MFDKRLIKIRIFPFARLLYYSFFFFAKRIGLDNKMKAKIHVLHWYIDISTANIQANESFKERVHYLL